MELNWKLCETLVVGLLNNGEVHIADPSQKSYVKEIDKLLNKEGGKKLTIENNKFNVRICGVNLMLSHPEFSEEYKLQNQSGVEEILRVISKIGLSQGQFLGGNNNWSLLMDSSKNFLPAIEGIDIYDRAEVDMIRRFSITNSPKTSKWVPGFSYHSETETCYYLGTICSWRDKESYVSTKYKQGAEELHMILSSEHYKPKSGNLEDITQVIKNNFENIQFLKKRTNKAKGSEFAKNNFSDMNSLIPDLVKKWVSDNESTYNKYSNLTVYKKELSSLFSIFEYSTSGETFVLDQPTKDLIIDIIKKSLKYNLIRYYYSDSIDTSRIKESLTNSFFNFIGGTVYNRKSYYEEIFNSLGIQIDPLIDETINNFNPAELSDTWEHYIENIAHVHQTPGPLTDFYLDESSTKSYYYGNYGNKDKFTDQEKVAFDEIIKHCREISKDPNEYSVRNMGTLSKPKLVEYFVITMDTIYNIYGNNVPEEIQNVLISGKFSKVTIKRDL